MFNKEQVRQQIIQYFKHIAAGQNIVQAIKQALFLNQNFNPLLVFQLISHGKQKITRTDWRSYLTAIKVPFCQKQIRYFFRHNHFGSEISLNQFLEALIPYNSDVIREYKAKYVRSLEFEERSREVEFILAELMVSWFGFIRSLINVRSELTHAVTKRDIENLVKEDLVLQSKPREARKFHQKFQQANFQLGFHQLRKFMQLWISPEDIIHQLCLLNIKRHLKCQNPFQKIVYRKHGRKLRTRSISRSHSRSVSARKSRNKSTSSVSASKSFSRSISRTKIQSRKPVSFGNGLTFKQKQQQRKLNLYAEKQQQERQLSPTVITENRPNSKYDQFKRSLKQNFQKSTNDYSDTTDFRSSQKQPHRTPPNPKNAHSPSPSPPPLHNQPSQNTLKSSQSELLKKLFQEIVLKEDRLEKLRKQLARNGEFSVIGLFKMIDCEGKGSVGCKELAEFCEGDADQYRCLVNFYGSDRDKLNISQFYTLFRPLSKQLNQALQSRPQTAPRKQQTHRLILQILNLQCQLHNNLASLRKRVRQQNFNLKTLFSIIDRQGKGYVDAEDFRLFLEECCISCEGKDLKCLMRLFYKRVDQRVGLREFGNFVDF